MFPLGGFGPSPIEKLLDQLEGKPVTDPVEAPIVLSHFLDEEDLLPELRAYNRRLVDYLSKDDTLKELIKYSLDAPETAGVEDRETVDKLRFKYPHVASEVLAAEVPVITTGVVQSSELMTGIFSLLDVEEGIHTVQANNFSKLIVSFLRTKNAETMNAMVARPNLMVAVLKNVNAAPIADVIVRILDNPETERPFSTIVEPPNQDAVRLLADNDVLVGLANLYISVLEDDATVAPEDERSRSEKIENIPAVIVGLTRRILQLEQAHYAMPENLNVFKDPQPIGRIIDTALDGDMKDEIVSLGLFHILGVVIELLTTELNLCSRSRPKNEEEQSQMNSIILAMTNSRPRASQTVGSSPLTSPKSNSSTHKEQLMSTFLLERELRPRLPRLLKLLQMKSGAPPITTTTGTVEHPLGSLKLRLVEFFVAALRTSGEDLLHALLDLDVPNQLLDLFFSYEWSSILHQVIGSAVLFAMDPEECRNTEIQKTWLKSYLVKQLMKSYYDYKEKKGADDNYRSGFLGHVILLSTKIEEFLNSFDYRPNKLEYLKEDVLDDFEHFCTRDLAEEKQRMNAPLGGERPGNSTRTVSDNENVHDEATEVFDMDEVMDELASGDSNDAMKQFAAYLFKNSDAPEFDSDGDDGGDGDTPPDEDDQLDDNSGDDVDKAVEV